LILFWLVSYREKSFRQDGENIGAYYLLVWNVDLFVWEFT